MRAVVAESRMPSEVRVVNLVRVGVILLGPVTCQWRIMRE